MSLEAKLKNFALRWYFPCNLWGRRPHLISYKISFKSYLDIVLLCVLVAILFTFGPC